MAEHEVPCEDCAATGWPDWTLLPHEVFNAICSGGNGYLCLRCFAKRVINRTIAQPAVLTLPPEPPVGTVVEVIDGHHTGEQLTHVGVSGWWTERGTAFTWAGLLAYWAGPAGVRVVGGG